MAAEPRSAAVIGAGAAGGATALLLSRRGWRVTLIESRPFPRAKVCGEFVSPAATALLENLLPPGELRSAGATRIAGITLEVGTRSRRLTLAEPAWALSRRSLDALLLQAARAAGADIRQPERAESVACGGHGAAVRLASGETVEAAVVIHADGHGRFDGSGPTPTADGLLGLKCHARLPEPIEGLRMRAGRGAYCGGIGVEDGLSTLAMCATPERLRETGGDRDALLADIWPGYEASQRSGGWLACGVARSGYIRPAHPRSFRIGNAAAAVDPVGGEGIGLAIWSASVLTGLLDDANDPPAVQRLFGLLYRRRIRARRPACRAAAELLMRPRLLRAAWPFIEADRVAIPAWSRLTGKRLVASP